MGRASFCEKMAEIDYDIDLDAVEDVVRSRGARRIVLQLPEGMLQYSLVIAKCLEERLDGVEVFIHADQTFGACDLHFGELDITLKPDIIVHVGHSPYPPELAHKNLEPQGSRILYVGAYSKLGVNRKQVLEAARLLREEYDVSRIGITTTAQHVHKVGEIEEILKAGGFKVAVHSGRSPYFRHAQVIGCDYSLARAVKADGYIFFGGGVFHPLGLYLATLKPVVKVDPYSGSVEDLTSSGEKIYRSRLFAVSKAIGARRWGIIVGIKTGQYRPWLVRKLVNAIAEAGGEYALIASEVTTLQQLVALDNQWYDAFTITSCPRLPTDDFWSYEKPVLTPGEALMAIEGRLEPYRFPW
ncbi:MAG: diphthamide biosynthesis enzyme Dph2 [Aeropyrum sp.]|nr:diphthamide biosynthesis enzyme Dph2 [Aeropyrum sp.]